MGMAVAPCGVRGPPGVVAACHEGRVVLGRAQLNVGRAEERRALMSGKGRTYS